MCGEGFVCLIRPNCDQLNARCARITGNMDCAVAQRLGRLFLRQEIRHVPFRNDQTGNFAMPAIDGAQGFARAICVGRENHPRRIRHFTQQGFRQSWILVGLFILGVFPCVRCGNERNADPARLLAEFLLPPGEDDFLAQSAEHLHRKGFIADREVQASLIA